MSLQFSGCKSIPQPNSKFCKDHRGFESPVVCSDDVTKETRSKLRSYRKKTSTTSNLPQDNVYVIETISATDTRKINDNDIKYYKVKWLGFPMSECTWEPESKIPEIIKDFYLDITKFGKQMPSPLVKNNK